jgi:hypothetical protein
LPVSPPSPRETVPLDPALLHETATYTAWPIGFVAGFSGRFARDMPLLLSLAPPLAGTALLRPSPMLAGAAELAAICIASTPDRMAKMLSRHTG